MNHQSDILTIVNDILAHVSVTRVKDTTELLLTKLELVFFRDNKAAVGFLTMIGLDGKDLLYVHDGSDNLHHFLGLWGLLLMLFN